MKLILDKQDLSLSTDMKYLKIPFNIHTHGTQLDNLKNKVSVEIKNHYEKRSLDANGKCWALCEAIAKVIGNTKINVYKKTIMEVGKYTLYPIKNEETADFEKKWNNLGIGYMAIPKGASRIEGYTNYYAYWGSSNYNTAEMSRLINELVLEAEELGIEVPPSKEIQSLLDEWDKK